MGCCLVALLLAGFPRLAILIYWLYRPQAFLDAFNGILVPIVGIIFLPWLTLMYVIVAPGGITGFDWALLALGAFLDLSSYGGGGAARKRRKD